MSTGNRIPLAEARKIAEDFARLFEGCWERWVIAGSIRRQMPDVGDCEHVVMPRMAPVLGDGMLVPEMVDLLWQRVDKLLADGTITKALYGESKTTRWGDIYRGCIYRGVKHEIFTATPENFGCILTIRTGPWEYSRAMQMELNRKGVYRQQDGYLRIAAGDNAGKVVPCPTEEAYFEAVGWKYKNPEERR